MPLFRKKLLFLSHVFPYPLVSGGIIRAYYQIEALARRYDVTLAYLAKSDENVRDIEPFHGLIKEAVPLLHYGENLIFQEPNSFFTRFCNFLKRESWYVKQNIHPAVIRELEKLGRRCYDIVFITHEVAMFDFFMVRSSFREAVVLCDFNDLDSDKYRQTLRVSIDKNNWRSWLDYKFLVRHEQRLSKMADISFIASDILRKKLQQKRWGSPIMVSPNGVDFSQYKVGLGNTEFPLSILYIGTMKYFPNIDGVHWFVEDVFPIIRRAQPQVKLFIVGDYDKDRYRGIMSIPGVELIGKVKEASEWFLKTSILIVPLRIGSGTRLKIIEALALGKAVVSTALGVEGLEGLKDNENLLIRNDAKGFADACVALLGDDEKRRLLGEHGRVVVEKKYDIKRIQEQFLDDIEHNSSK